MIIKEFTLAQISMINEVLSLRLKNCDDYLKWAKRIEIIKEKLNSELIELSPLDRALICGCIREFVISPNEDFFILSDREIYGSINTFKSRIDKVDIGLSILNKLDKYTKIKFDYLADRMNKIIIDMQV